MPSKQASTESAFTLIEMMVVIAIISILAALILTVGWGSVMKARATACMNKMRQIGMAMANPGARALAEGSPDLWKCPQGPQDGATNYGINEHLRLPPTDVNDTGATVLLYESKRAGEELKGAEWDVDPRHMGGSNFVFVDGHAKWSRAIPPFQPR
jgi:prepilin-type N-terminal cleavage/methylation domain-containing protein/prepilin-type processing-associated H-X9-DG protein